MMGYSDLAGLKIMENAAKALLGRGVEVHIVEDRDEARTKAVSFIPQGSEVLALTSMTLDECGISKEIEDSGKYQSVRKRIGSVSDKSERDRVRRRLSACEWAIGSVHAVSEEGEVFVASQSGSNIAPYSFGASNVVWVVGGQKIVRDREQALKRLYEHCLPLEDARAKKAYGIGSSINRIFIFEKEPDPKRIKLIFVKERLGF